LGDVHLAHVTQYYLLFFRTITQYVVMQKGISKNNFYPALMAAGSPIITVVTSSLSILGSCLIIGTYFMYKDIQTPSRHLIVCISISDLFYSLAILFTSYGVKPDTSQYCILQSFVSTTAMMCSFMWTMMLAIFLFISLDRERPSLAIRLIHPWFHLLS